MFLTPAAESLKNPTLLNASQTCSCITAALQHNPVQVCDVVQRACVCVCHNPGLLMLSRTQQVPAAQLICLAD